jgi:L-ascorbate metabolism protein UlaG (beta-lactamase superfamily)
MIKPVLQGAALVDDILAARPEPGEVHLWWMAQSGYAIKTASILFYIDLYLSEILTDKYASTAKPHVRMTAAPARGSDLHDAPWLFASHIHTDHLDPGTAPAMMAVSPDMRLILPLALRRHAINMGLDPARLITLRGDDTAQIGPMTVHAIPSAHPTLDFSEEAGYPFLGFVFQMDGLTLYHTGDTILYDGLAERLSRFDIDIAFLPINGTDAERLRLNVAPNMNMQEAVDLAKTLGVRLAIPHHYDLFTFNTADVNDYARRAELARQPTAMLRPGERFCWRR